MLWECPEARLLGGRYPENVHPGRGRTRVPGALIIPVLSECPESQSLLWDNPHLPLLCLHVETLSEFAFNWRSAFLEIRGMGSEVPLILEQNHFGADGALGNLITQSLHLPPPPGHRCPSGARPGDAVWVA